MCVRDTKAYKIQVGLSHCTFFNENAILFQTFMSSQNLSKFSPRLPVLKYLKLKPVLFTDLGQDVCVICLC